MYFLPTPQAVFMLLNISLPKLLLGSKVQNEAAWRRLSTVLKSKNRPQKRTVVWVNNLLVQQTSTNLDPCNTLLELYESEKTYETAWDSFCAAFTATRDDIYPTFCSEVTKLGASDKALFKTIKSGDLHNAVVLLRGWQFSDAESMQALLNNLETDDKIKFTKSVIPLWITNALYLLACWEVDEFESEDVQVVMRYLPACRGGRLILPMTRWMENIKAVFELESLRELDDFVLSPRGADEDIETLRRQARKWRQKGEIPAWSKVPHIIESLDKNSDVGIKDIYSKDIYRSLAIVRILDNLLRLGDFLKDQYLPAHEPLRPFEDYPALYNQAAKVKAALQLREEK